MSKRTWTHGASSSDLITSKRSGARRALSYNNQFADRFQYIG
jgi:hypothetical protein